MIPHQSIRYKDGYKYQLADDFSISIGLYPPKAIETRYARLTATGELTIFYGYAWDGPSGPPMWLSELPLIGWLYRRYMLPQFMRGALVHDCLYQFMRNGELHAEAHRLTADRVMRRICVTDGMSGIRSLWCYIGVRIGGLKGAAVKKPIIQAP